MTLTREEILNQPAGRKLDRWIQEHIFKWIPWKEQRGDYFAITFQKPGDREPFMKTQRREEAKQRYQIIPYSEINDMLHDVYGDKNWSTDISAAWEVEEKIAVLEKEGHYVKALCDVVGTPRDGTRTLAMDDWRMLHAKPEQRCKAALLAVLNL
ncbi:hypothetical protein [Paenibacillus riograndensis]|uniref:hypothetical protein n=1 Tax=Paenibacillus riograndensis TaxID=483937 RepID=UPI0007649B0E|nr:hypothetical protein [Paenibacillus riograndensis]